ncbi:hypothetical protein Ae150APs1_1609 [Pseudonocardia sp. Ae150A_Ps1]|nr:hypothetical protein Ae150APs1_1609 [Pseudonocardia sp. Ae150A_Ps1]
MLDDLVGGEPVDAARLVGGGGLAAGGSAPEDESNDAAGQVLVGAGQPLNLDGDAGLFDDLTAHTLFEGLPQLQDPAGGLPVGVVAALNDEDAAVVAHDDSGDTHGMLRRAGHDYRLPG